MKKIFALTISICLILSLIGCKHTEENSYLDTETNKNSYFSTKIKTSPDKYTWYIKNYVGRNCATIGYFTVGGYINESYGEGSVKLIIITEDGSFVDSDTLKDYVVIEQNVAPNTELKYVFSDNEKYSNLVVSQNIEEIEILVKRVDNK